MDALDSYDLAQDIPATTTDHADTTPESPAKRKEEVESEDTPAPKKRKVYRPPAKPSTRPTNPPINLKDFKFSRDVRVEGPKKDSKGGTYYPMKNAHTGDRLLVFVKDGCVMPRHGCSKGLDNDKSVSYNFNLKEDMWAEIADALLQDAAEYCVSRGLVRNVTKTEKVVEDELSRCMIRRAGESESGKHHGPSLKMKMGKFAKVFEMTLDDDGNPVRYDIQPTPATADEEEQYDTLRNREVKSLVFTPISFRFLKKTGMTVKCYVDHLVVGEAAKEEEQAYAYDYLLED